MDQPTLWRLNKLLSLDTRFWISCIVCLCCAWNSAYAVEKDLKPVTVQLKWKHQFQFAGFYAAKAQGYYQDIGLDVTFKEAHPGINPIEEVLSGNADYGVANAELLLYRMIGEPVTALASIFQHSPLVLMTLRESGIASPQQLIGKKVMFPNGPYGANTLGILLKEGVHPSQVQQVPLSFNIDDLIHKKVDAMVGYVTDKPYLLQQRDIEYNVIEPRVYGVDFYGDTLFTTEANAKNKFLEVKAFRAATLKGWRYAISHQRELVDLIIAEYGNTLDRDALLFEAKATVGLIMPELVELGHMNPGRWQHIAQVFRELKLVDGGFDQTAFLFDPQKHTLARQVESMHSGILAVAVLVLSFLLGLVFFNNHLKQQVRKQTEHLEEANQFLVKQTQELIAAETKVSELNKVLEKRVEERTEALFAANQELKNEVKIREEKELRLQLLSTALENGSSLVVIVDKQGRVSYINNAFKEFSGQVSNNMDGFMLEDLEPFFQFPSMDEEAFLNYARTHRKMELCGHDAAGRSHWFQTTISPIFTGAKEPSHFVIICDDVTRLKQRHDEMERLAFYDPLTGLENRVLFKHNVNKILDLAKRENLKSALLFIDLDHFKDVNDNFGHETGDLVLKTIAARIKNQVRESDSVARISGDEFSVLLVDIRDAIDVAKLASYILQEAIKPIKHLGEEHFVSASIGISITPDDTLVTDELIRFADLAMYKAKRNGRNNYHFYSGTTQLETAENVNLAQDILDSIEESQFLLEYQPQVCLQSHKIKAVEALMRWNRDDGKVKLPEEFLEVAETNNLILKMGQWLVKEIENARTSLREADMESVKVSINLSPRQFQDESFVAVLAEAAKKSQGNVNDVQIEVKESALFEKPEESLRKLKHLSDLGYSIAIDDFGVGNLSVSYLRQFPVDTIKIDKTLISRLPADQEAAEIVIALITLAHKLRIDVVAEGVESEPQMHFLKNNNCDMAQGYYISHALPLQDVISHNSTVH